MTVSVHSFQITSRGGGSGFKYSIAAESAELALEVVQEKYALTSYIIRVLDVHEGAFEDYLGAETVERIEHAKSVLRKNK